MQATFAEIILLRKLSNCSGCGRGVSAAPLAWPTAPMSLDLNETLRYSYNLTGRARLRKTEERRGEERRGEERRGEERRGGMDVRRQGDGDEHDKSSEPEQIGRAHV